MRGGGGGGTVCHTEGTQYIRCTQYPWFDTLLCREYFDSKQISAVSFLTVVFGAKVLKILQICASSPSKYCMLSILEIKGLPKGGSRAPQDPTPSLRPCKRYLITLPTAVIVAVVFGNFIFSLFTKWWNKKRLKDGKKNFPTSIYTGPFLLLSVSDFKNTIAEKLFPQDGPLGHMQLPVQSNVKNTVWRWKHACGTTSSDIYWAMYQ